MKDSASKRADDSKSLANKEGALADMKATRERHRRLGIDQQGAWSDCAVHFLSSQRMRLVVEIFRGEERSQDIRNRCTRQGKGGPQWRRHLACADEEQEVLDTRMSWAHLSAKSHCE